MATVLRFVDLLTILPQLQLERQPCRGRYLLDEALDHVVAVLMLGQRNQTTSV